MADLTAGEISGTTNPYMQGSYTVGSNEKNTLSITSYFKLLAAQLANQDMTKPMDNGEMMAQLTNMAMVQSVSAMTESVELSTAVTTQTYAAGLVGQEITVAKTEDGPYGQPEAVGVIYGTVESVSLMGGSASFKLAGDDKEYPLSYLLGMGKIKDPYGEEDKEASQQINDHLQAKLWE